MKASSIRPWIIVTPLLLTLFLAELLWGSVPLSLGEVLGSFRSAPDSLAHLIVMDSRLPRALTAVLAGGGLALCGLLMQRFFQNPLAGPSVLGISSGASLGVALVVLAGGQVLSSAYSIAGAAFLGAMLVLLLILVFSLRLKSPVSLLIFGLMMGYLVGALVTILQRGSSSESLRSFVFWGMGSFADLRWSDVGLLAMVVVPGVLVSAYLHRQLDLWSLGEEYARSSGLNLFRFRTAVLVITGMITGVITAFCGPVAFLGLAAPHLARGLWQEGRHGVLIPAVMVSGALVALACDLFTRLPEGGLPLNAVTSFFGAPVVIYLLLKGRRVY